MYGLPADFDSNALTGCVLETVCFAEYSVYLHFSRDIIITIMSSYSMDGVIFEIPTDESGLMKFVGKAIKNVICLKNSDIKFIFDNNIELIILNTDDQYESYSIKIFGREIIV